VCTFLKDRKVAARQARAAERYLADRGVHIEIDVAYDESNPLQKGSSIVLWAKTDMNRVLGADAIGELGKSSEAVGQEAAEKLLTEISSQATVDIHLADMLVPYVALAEGESVYLTRSMTDHLATNIWLTEKILNVEFETLKMNDYYKIVKKE
jgi:RNA 3'-terminal phosphate cyclase (ATP)